MNKILDTVVFGIGAFVAFIIVFFAITTLCAWPVMLLWNWICPIIFNLPVITFWQSWGLMMLCGFLFKNSNTNTINKK